MKPGISQSKPKGDSILKRKATIMHNYNTIEKENSYEYDGNTNEVL